MAVPRIRLSAIKPVPDQVIVPIVNAPTPETAEPVVPVALGVPVPVPETESMPAVSLGVPGAIATATAVASVPAMPEPPGEGENPPATSPQFAMPAAPSVSAVRPADEPVAEAMLKRSLAPVVIRSSSVMVKWTLVAAILLVVAFVTIRFLVPFFTELKKPKSAVVVVDKDASFAVRALQQTRQVAAKNEAKVAYLNEVVATGETNPAAVKPVAPPASTRALSRGYGATPDLAPYHDVLARLKVESVVAGAVARAMIDGRLVKQGDIIDRNLGLRFSGVDTAEHVLLFTNAENLVFKKHY